MSVDQLIICFICAWSLSSCWELTLDHGEIMYANPDVCEMKTAVNKINRTTAALNISLNLFQDLPADADLRLELFGFFSNTYRKLPINITRRVCDAYYFEYTFIKDDLNSNFKCPVKKGEVYIRNYIPNTKKFPNCPWSASQYYTQFSLLYHGVVKCQYRLYTRVSRDDEYRRRT